MDNADARSGRHEMMNAEGIVDKDEERQALLDSVKKSEHLKSKPSFSSASSDLSSEDDFFQLDSTTLGKPTRDLTLTSDRKNLSSELGELMDTPKLTTQAGSGSQLASEVIAEGDEAVGDGDSPAEDKPSDPGNFSLLGVNQTPQGQAGGYDPNRIPAAIFAAKPLNPVDWSIASNESLFSIQVGNSSFSREHGLLLSRYGDLGNFSYSPPEPHAPGSPLPVSVDPVEVAVHAASDLVHAAETEALNAQAMEDVLRAVTGEDDDIDLPLSEGTPCSAIIPRPSDASSIHSFAFPILPAGGTGSVKVAPELPSQWDDHPEVEMENPQGITKAPQHKWFHCFSCSLCHVD